MNSALLTPTKNETDYDSGDALIAVRMRMPPVFCSAPFFPEGNGIGKTLLYKILMCRLEANGIAVASVGASLPFNKCFVVFVLHSRRDLLRGLEIVCDELDSLSLTPMATVAWHDPQAGDGVLRTYVPKGGVLEFPSESERQEDSDQEKQFVRVLSQAVKEHNAKNPPPSAPAA